MGYSLLTCNFQSVFHTIAFRGHEKFDNSFYNIVTTQFPGLGVKLMQNECKMFKLCAINFTGHVTV